MQSCLGNDPWNNNVQIIPWYNGLSYATCTLLWPKFHQAPWPLWYGILWANVKCSDQITSYDTSHTFFKVNYLSSSWMKCRIQLCPMFNGKHNITSCKARSVRYYTNYTTTVGAQAFVSMHASTGVWSDVVDTLGVSIAIITQIVAFIEVYEK